MNPWTEIVGGAVTVVAVAGAVLNNHRRRECFLAWMASNAASAGLHIAAGMIALACRDLIFLGLAVDGWRRWGRKEKTGKSLSQRAQRTQRKTRRDKV